MPKPKRSNKATPAAAKEQKPMASDEAKVEAEDAPVASTPEPDESGQGKIDELEAQLAEERVAQREAEEKLQLEHEQEMQDLRDKLAAAQKQIADEANAENIDFDERPPVGVKWYYEVTFHPKRTDGDQFYVEAGVNGKIMQWQRGVRTGLRSDYREVIDNAFVPKFKQLPGEDRKSIGGLKPFTYTIHRKISEEEYMEMKKAGDEHMKQALVNGGN